MFVVNGHGWGVFAEIRNGFECFCKCNIFVFQIWVKKNSVPGSILLFGNVSFNIVVRINHDNVGSRGAVGRTHTITMIVRLQTRIRGKDGTENFGGLVYLLDEFLQRDFGLLVLMCSINLSVSFSRPPRRGLPRPVYTPGLSRLYHHGYHACA